MYKDRILTDVIKPHDIKGWEIDNIFKYTLEYFLDFLDFVMMLLGHLCMSLIELRHFCHTVTLTE